MATTIETPNFFVRHICDHRCSFRILAEKLFANVGAIVCLVGLILAINGFFHELLQQAVIVICQQRVPTRTPNQFYDIPAGAAECRFQFLNNLAVAADGPVESLQVAVHNEYEIIEAFAYRHGNRAHRLGLVHLAVAKERPDLAIRGRDHVAIFHVAHKACLVDRHHRAKPHRHGRELPEIRHQPGMRIG